MQKSYRKEFNLDELKDIYEYYNSDNSFTKNRIKNSKYSAMIKSFFQPEKPIQSAFPLYAIQSRKG